MKKLLTLCCVAVLTACSSTNDGYDGSPTYNGRTSSEYRTTMDVTRVDIIDKSRHNGSRYGVENSVSPAPAQMASHWFQNRFSAANNDAYAPRLEVIIHEATLTKKPLIIDGPNGQPCLQTAKFRRGEAATYRAAVSIEVRVISCTGQVLASTFANTFEEQVLGNNDCTPHRDVSPEALIYKAIQKADDELERGVDMYLNRFVR